MLEGGGVEVVEDDLLNLLLDLLGLAQDDVAFPLDGRCLELGVLQDIGKDVDALRYILVKGLGEVDGVLALCYCQIWYSPSSMVLRDVQRCRRSGARRGSRSRAQAVVVSGWPYPFKALAICPAARLPASVRSCVP